MNTLTNPELQRNLYDLNQVTIDFLKRMTQLTQAGLESVEKRTFRVVNCGESNLTHYHKWMDSKNLNEVSDLQQQWLSEYRDAYMDVLCNSQQVAVLTHDEIQYWILDLVDGWFRLADSVWNIDSLRSNA